MICYSRDAAFVLWVCVGFSLSMVCTWVVFPAVQRVIDKLTRAA